MHLKRLLVVLIAVLLGLLLIASIVRGLLSLNVISVDSIVSVAGTPPPTDAHGHTNVLLIGQGDANHDGKDLTDTIMVASLDPKDTKSAVLLSLPRDLYFLKTEKMGKGRINSMYRDYKSYLWYQKGIEKPEAKMQALHELKDEIGRKLGMEIHHAIKVDFQGFVKAVDILDGITVEVLQSIEDTEYPDGNYGFETFALPAGTQTLDGETALKYARSRHTTSDFNRSARQQQILQAMAQQAKSSGLATDPTRVASLLQTLKDHVDSTMTLSEMVGMAEVGKSIDRKRIVTMQLSDRNALYDGFIEPGGFLYTPPRDLFEGASVLLPISIPEFPVTWKQIRALTTLMIQQRSAHLAAPKIAVLNGGAPSGSARKLGNELVRYGFTVETIENASSGDQPTTTISSKTEADSAIASFFATLLQGDVAALPSQLEPEQGTQITIIIGEDYTYTPLQDLITPQS